MTNKVISPLKVPMGKKEFTLNLNKYRNTHYQPLNEAKQNYKYIIRSQVIELREFNRVRIKYTLFPANKVLCDLSNVLSIHDKFFADSLVLGGKLPDDNYKFIPGSIYEFGAVDKKNPRVEIEVFEDGMDDLSRLASYEKALKEIIALPGSRQDEANCIAMNAIDTFE